VLSVLCRETNVVDIVALLNEGELVVCLAILGVAPNPFLAPFYESAGVPSPDASNNEKSNFLSRVVFPLCPSVFISLGDNAAAWRGVRLTTSKKAALDVSEAFDLGLVRGLSGVGLEIGEATGERGMLRSGWLYVDKTVLADVIEKTDAENNHKGVIYETDSNGKRVKCSKTTRYYLQVSDAFDLVEMWRIFCDAVGITAKINAEEMRIQEERLARQVVATEKARLNAESASAKADATAKDMKKRAKDKADAAAKVLQNSGLSLEAASEIVAKSAKETAKADAENTEAESINAGENVRKKASTKKLAQNYVQK